MVIEARRLHYNEHGDPILTIVAEGSHDVYRLAHHLTTGQVEFARIGFDVERKLRRRWGKSRWAWLMRYMHGDGGYL